MKSSIFVALVYTCLGSITVACSNDPERSQNSIRETKPGRVSSALSQPFKTNSEIIEFSSNAVVRNLAPREKDYLKRAAEAGLISAYYVLYLNESMHGDQQLSESYLVEGAQAQEPNSLAILAGRTFQRALKTRDKQERLRLSAEARTEFVGAFESKLPLTVSSKATLQEEIRKIDSMP